MDRTRAPDDTAAAAQAATVDDVALVDLEASAQRLRSFPELVAALEGSTSAQRTRLADDVNRVLRAMRAPGHEAEEAEVVMQALSSKALHDLEDSRGRSCRREAVETMMASGFPHALLLDPEDVAFARERHEEPPDQELSAWERSMQHHRRLAAGLMAGGQVASVVAVGSTGGLGGFGDVAMVGVALAGLACAGALWATRPRDLNTGTWGMLAIVTGIAGFAVAATLSAWSAALAPLGVLAGLFVALGPLYEERADEPSPGDWDFMPRGEDD
ncbi:MAG: hypothetical protein JNJ54_35745 [Myxococcaceae bacterium]|nr:hypothetical protein [Myxococcaceae bacterium]